MRLRNTSPWDAGNKRAIELGAIPDPRTDTSGTNWSADYLLQLEATEAARAGDCWRIRRDPEDGRRWTWTDAYDDGRTSWPIIGYWLTCPLPHCTDGVHGWTHAYNCPARDDAANQCKQGEGRLSCWDWTGSPEAGDLTASPSLQMLPPSCEFHGFLRNGVLA